MRASEAITWTVSSLGHKTLDSWCATTGPPVITPQPSRVTANAFNQLVVVTWNIHGGAADLNEFVQRLQEGAFTNGHAVERFVLLLQEAHRADRVVPRTPVPGARTPRAAGVGRGKARRPDVVRLAESLDLAVYYVPSMRNGAPADTDEDRGNAILSTEPLSEFTAIELPFEHQRRVAITAAISVQDPAGRWWPLRVASAHLESSVPASRLWVFAMGARRRQARALLDALNPDRPVVLGGDFNTLLGSLEPAYRNVAAAIPDIGSNDRRPTFASFARLDYLFSRMPEGWTVTVTRLDDRLGSDHFPVLASFKVAGVATH
jgi:endonuclease/exonuclease/phosphatase family metal-dependent hydrolase